MSEGEARQRVRDRRWRVVAEWQRPDTGEIVTEMIDAAYHVAVEDEVLHVGTPERAIFIPVRLLVRCVAEPVKPPESENPPESV